MYLVILLVAAVYAYRVFRKVLGETTDQGVRRILDEAERLTGYRKPNRRWIRPAIATVLAWSAVTALLTPVDPTMAVYVGGAMVFAGVAAVIRSVPDPTRIHPDDLDRALIELLEQA